MSGPTLGAARCSSASTFCLPCFFGPHHEIHTEVSDADEDACQKLWLLMLLWACQTDFVNHDSRTLSAGSFVWIVTAERQWLRGLPC